MSQTVAPTMTLEQERKAAHYTVLFLREEIKTLKPLLKQNGESTVNDNIRRRMNELQKDLNIFEKINDELS